MEKEETKAVFPWTVEEVPSGLSSKDFDEMVEVIRYSRAQCRLCSSIGRQTKAKAAHLEGQQSGIDHVASNLAGYMQKIDPTFDAQRFIEACKEGS